MVIHESKDVQLAKKILRGQAAAPVEMLDLAKRLKSEKRFGYARKILARARMEKLTDADLRLQLCQQHALCTYKDPDLPVGVRLNRALEILQEIEDLPQTNNQETLGLAGAIHKRKWEVDGQKQHLERSLSYYVRGYQQGPVNDEGYTGINAAFVLDLLADQEAKEAAAAGAASEIARARRVHAQQIRENLVSTLMALAQAPDTKEIKGGYWVLVTLAEAHFGLRQYDAALPYLKAAAGLSSVAEWEKETTARQLAAIARSQEEKTPAAAAGEKTAQRAVEMEGSRAWEVLKAFLGNHLAAVRSVFTGRIGLALSGGGFRASLFHIGVLARLAELDMLRHIEVLSCVSGGSIIGAHYYLEVRKLLQEKTDSEITAQDYIQIVDKISQEFLAGVQRNIRTRVAANPWVNLKMAFLPNYSRTERVGELYESELFAHVKDGLEKKPRWINHLVVKPKGDEDFTPKFHNWRRHAKVPILILNATTLNTGHNWQFTATWMGEPPVYIDAEVDPNYRLRRMWYDEAPEDYREFSLGDAVASSSCVPGMFEPLALPGLYPDRIVRLVDGGVHDNQGVASLLEQDCNVMLVSDASGQTAAQDKPSASVFRTLMNADSILQQRLREAQYHDLSVRRRSSLLRGLMFVHLKKDLESEPVSWIGCEDPPDPEEVEARGSKFPGLLTRYGIRKEIQELLAKVRTDLDSFNDTEAYALMISGYRMTEHEFDAAVAPHIKDLPPPVATRPDWKFLAIEKPMTQAQGFEAADRELRSLLEAANSRAFKIWMLSRPLKIAGTALGLGLAVLLGWLCWKWWTRPLLTVGNVAGAIAATVAGLVVGKAIVRVARFRDTLARIAIGIGTCLFGSIAAGVHLYVFDKLYLKRGRVDHVLQSQQP